MLKFYPIQFEPKYTAHRHSLTEPIGAWVMKGVIDGNDFHLPGGKRKRCDDCIVGEALEVHWAEYASKSLDRLRGDEIGYLCAEHYNEARKDTTNEAVESAVAGIKMQGLDAFEILPRVCEAFGLRVVPMTVNQEVSNEALGDLTEAVAFYMRYGHMAQEQALKIASYPLLVAALRPIFEASGYYPIGSGVEAASLKFVIREPVDRIANQTKKEPAPDATSEFDPF